MVEGVQRGRERHSGPRVRTGRAQEEAGAEPEHDDPNVLDRAEREQTLQLMLEDRVDDADHRGGTDQHHDDAVPRRQLSEPLDEDADEAVDRHLDHHATHRAATCAGAIGCARGSQV